MLIIPFLLLRHVFYCRLVGLLSDGLNVRISFVQGVLLSLVLQFWICQIGILASFQGLRNSQSMILCEFDLLSNLGLELTPDLKELKESRSCLECICGLSDWYD